MLLVSLTRCSACLVATLAVSGGVLGLQAQANEFRALWVDAWSGDFASPSKCSQLISDARAGNFNALIVQVRRRGDAFYNSLFEPKNSSISSSFDPLADLIRKAHDTAGGQPRIEIHAWIVTYNIWNNQATPPGASSPPHPFNAHAEWLTRDVNGATWDNTHGVYAFDPAHPEVQRHTFNVAMDLITRYDLDGLNWDYIRYNGPTWGYHPVAVARFNARSGRTGIPPKDDEAWKQFRRDEVTALVRKVYLHAIALKPHLKLSADTITWAPGPQSGADWYASGAWTEVLQDWRGWMEEGILDLNVPMAYFNHATRATDFLRWSAFAKNHRYGRHVAIGPGLYLNVASNAIVQLREFRQPTTTGAKADGVCGYVYKLLNVDNAVPRSEFLAALTQPSAYDPIQPAVFAEPALPPPMPWKTTPTRGHVLGQVRHRLNGTDLDGATVRFSGPVTRTLTSDGTGFFGAVDLLPGTYTLTASFPGLDPVTTNCLVTAGLVTTRDLELGPALADQVIRQIESFPGRTAAIVSWQLSDPVPAFVEYGSTTNLGLVTPILANSSTNREALLTPLPAGQDVHFRVVARTAGGDVRSRLHVLRTAGDVILDNPAAAFAGSWTTGTSAVDKYAANYQYAGTTTGSATATATYTPLLQTPGRYDLYVWAPGGSNRSTNAPFEIGYDGGQQTVRLNQTPQHAGWRLLLANRPFRRGEHGYVRLANHTGESGKVIMADAVRWAYAPGQDPAPPGEVPDWWAAYYFGSPVAGSIDHDGDGASTHAEYWMGTAPTVASSRLLVQIEAADPGQVRLRFQPAYQDRLYRLQVRDALGGDSWTTRQDLSPSFESDGSGIFLLTPPADARLFLRVEVTLAP